jgi:TolB-like protein/tetratricopeptide (TPR) repeat protein
MPIVEELKRRSVFQTAALYIAVAWGGTEILAFLIDALWGEQRAAIASKYLAILFIAGFPVAMYLAWSRDLGSTARRYVSAAGIGILLTGALAWLVPSGPEAPYSPSVPASGVMTLAVLPLDDLAATPGQDYFAGGMTEALIAELSKLGTLKVISRTSVMQYKGTTKTVPEIARELGANMIVEGSVLRSGDQVRITAQLIEAATDHHLWADSFEGDMQDVLGLQGDAAKAIVRGIGGSIEVPGAQSASHQRVDPQAFDAYLRARMKGLEAQGNAEDVIEAAEQVIEIDPSFAPGYAYLSDLYGYLALTTNVTHGDAYLHARRLADKAVELDPDLPYARVAMARVLYQFEWDWEAAQAEFERALQLDPNNAEALELYGSLRVLILEDCEGGLALLDAARERDPFNPAAHFNLGVYNFHCRQHEESIRHLEYTNELAPSFFRPRLLIAWNHALMGQFVTANDECDAVLSELGDSIDVMAQSSCGWVYHLGGRQDEAHQILEKLQTPVTGLYVDPVLIAFFCAGIEETECALDALEAGYQQRSSNLIFLRTGPAFDVIRDEPRFQAIVDKMNFPPPVSGMIAR